ncbi:MAG TPA: IS1182 family transposase, partial [Candidatus Acidoferrum sp.]
MDKRFRTCSLDQLFLLPPSLQDWLPEDHLARFIADVMDELDLSALYTEYQRRDARGLAAYHPLLMTRLLLYGYCIGVTSSRRIERATFDNVAFRYLATNQHPDHDTIAEFRRRHLAALAQLFVQALRLCQKAGMVKLGNVAIDGTKILANASTRRSVPYAKLCEREQYWQQIVDQLLAEAERTDLAEDERWGQGKPADPLPEKLALAQSRLARLRQAKAELEREARERYETIEREAGTVKRGRPSKQDPPRTKRQQRVRKQRQRARQNAAAPQRQYNFVDPDSRVMKDNARKCFVQAYNAQVAADAEKQVIVAAELTQDVTDRNQLVAMVKAVSRTAEAVPVTVTADAGYWNTDALADSALNGIEALVAPDSTAPSPDMPLPANAPATPEAVRMRTLLATPEGRARFGLRKQTVEPVFGQIKETRGIRRLRLRTLEKASAEWKLICATHNLLKLYRERHRQKPRQPRVSGAGVFPRRHSHASERPTPSRRAAICQNRRPELPSRNFSPTGSQAVPVLKKITPRPAPVPPPAAYPARPAPTRGRARGAAVPSPARA